jgi:hypothetical protein
MISVAVANKPSTWVYLALATTYSATVHIVYHNCKVPVATLHQPRGVGFRGMRDEDGQASGNESRLLYI